MNCIFCSIVKGELPSQKVYEDGRCMAFLDINPQAPAHILVVTKDHIGSAADICGENSVSVAAVFEAIPKIARELGLKSFRVVTNSGPEAGQTVNHLHFHVLGGKMLAQEMV